MLTLAQRVHFGMSQQEAADYNSDQLASLLVASGPLFPLAWVSPLKFNLMLSALGRFWLRLSTSLI